MPTGLKERASMRNTARTGELTEISVTSAEKVRLVVRSARHGPRHHRRRCEHGLNLRAIEPAVFENLVG
jgi:hypothetical protein